MVSLLYQLQSLVIALKFCILHVRLVYMTESDNDADQTADAKLNLRICLFTLHNKTENRK